MFVWILNRHIEITHMKIRFVEARCIWKREVWKLTIWKSGVATNRREKDHSASDLGQRWSNGWLFILYRTSWDLKTAQNSSEISGLCIRENGNTFFGVGRFFCEVIVVKYSFGIFLCRIWFFLLLFRLYLVNGNLNPWFWKSTRIGVASYQW